MRWPTPPTTRTPSPWYRAVFAGGEPVGFVMISWDVEPARRRRSWARGSWWKLLIDRRHQGCGDGPDVVRQVAELVRSQGATNLLTSYVPGGGGAGRVLPAAQVRADGRARRPRRGSSCASCWPEPTATFWSADDQATGPY